jgi:hypothetical protein
MCIGVLDHRKIFSRQVRQYKMRHAVAKCRIDLGKIVGISWDRPTKIRTNVGHLIQEAIEDVFGQSIHDEFLCDWDFGIDGGNRYGCAEESSAAARGFIL